MWKLEDGEGGGKREGYTEKRVLRRNIKLYDGNFGYRCRAASFKAGLGNRSERRMRKRMIVQVGGR